MRCSSLAGEEVGICCGRRGQHSPQGLPPPPGPAPLSGNHPCSLSSASTAGRGTDPGPPGLSPHTDGAWGIRAGRRDPGQLLQSVWSRAAVQELQLLGEDPPSTLMPQQCPMQAKAQPRRGRAGGQERPHYSGTSSVQLVWRSPGLSWRRRGARSPSSSWTIRC